MHKNILSTVNKIAYLVMLKALIIFVKLVLVFKVLKLQTFTVGLNLISKVYFFNRIEI